VGAVVVAGGGFEVGGGVEVEAGPDAEGDEGSIVSGECRVLRGALDHQVVVPRAVGQVVAEQDTACGRGWHGRC